MTTEEALLAAIWASPHDDLPRLVYADWLDETGDPTKAARAEFIRVQCELAKLTGKQDKRWVPLKSAEMRLLKQFNDVFRNERGGNIRDSSFHRGFLAPHRRVVNLNTLLGWPDGILERAPLWEFLVNYAVSERVPELLASPRLQRIGFLGLWQTDDAMAVALAESPHAINVSSIHFRRGTVTEAGMRAIAHSPHLPHLRALIVSLAHPNWLNLQFARELVNSPLADRLRILDITDQPRSALAAEELLRERFGGRLVILQ